MKNMYVKRNIEPDIERWVQEREILAIRGPRQSGKTTLLSKIIDMLKHRGVNEENIHFINFEDDLTKLEFEENPKEFVEFHMDPEKRNYFLMDEVQYIKNPGKKLKLLFDSFENIKLIVTGSSSFNLTNMGSFLVGRVIFFDLYPFDFSEFLRAKSSKYEKLYEKIRLDLSKKSRVLKKTVFTDELNKLLHEYLTFGSYPRVVLEKSKRKKMELLKNLFTTYIEKDIVSLYGIRDREKVVKLLKTLSYASGNVVTYEMLAENSGLKYHEIRDLVPLLEDSFVVSTVRPFHRNLAKELRKNPKIYFVDYGMRNYMLQNFGNIDFSHLYENFVYNQLKNNFEVKYWRTTTKSEVDFILENHGLVIPVEVKRTPKVTRSFRSFINYYNPGTGIVANLKTLKRTRINSSEILFVPFVYL